MESQSMKEKVEESVCKKRRTGYSCAVGECALTHADGMSIVCLHIFSSDIKKQRVWINIC